MLCDNTNASECSSRAFKRAFLWTKRYYLTVRAHSPHRRTHRTIKWHRLSRGGNPSSPDTKCDNFIAIVFPLRWLVVAIFHARNTTSRLQGYNNEPVALLSLQITDTRSSSATYTRSSSATSSSELKSSYRTKFSRWPMISCRFWPLKS